MILMMGPSGAGKSSQATMLSESDPRYKNIEIGQLLRQSQEPEVKKLLTAGELVGDEIVLELIKSALKELSSDQEAILDGFPRRLSQTPLLDDLLQELGQDIRKVIVLKTDLETVQNRLGKRGRDDDKAAVIQKKWQLYQQQTSQVVDFYRQQGLVIEIDANGTVGQVNNSILKALGSGN